MGARQSPKRSPITGRYLTLTQDGVPHTPTVRPLKDSWVFFWRKKWCNNFLRYFEQGYSDSFSLTAPHCLESPHLVEQFKVELTRFIGWALNSCCRVFRSIIEYIEKNVTTEHMLYGGQFLERIHWNSCNSSTLLLRLLLFQTFFGGEGQTPLIASLSPVSNRGRP